MKKLMMFVLSVVIVALAACSGKSEKKEDKESSLKFETIIEGNTERLEEDEGKEIEVDEKFSYTVEFTYPSEFSDQKVLEKLKQNFIKNTFGENFSGLSLNEIIDTVVVRWKNTYLENGSDLQLMQGVYNDVLYVSDELLQYNVCTYESNGASHLAQLSYHLLSLETGDEYKQADIFKPESANDIRQLITSQIQSQESVDSDWDMESAWTPETNFSVTDKGILIQYNAYELGTRNSPEEEILLPYKQILSYLKKDTPVYTLAAK